jgi:hypothetical protein
LLRQGEDLNVPETAGVIPLQEASAAARRNRKVILRVAGAHNRRTKRDCSGAYSALRQNIAVLPTTATTSSSTARFNQSMLVVTGRVSNAPAQPESEVTRWRQLLRFRLPAIYPLTDDPCELTLWSCDRTDIVTLQRWARILTLSRTSSSRRPLDALLLVADSRHNQRPQLGPTDNLAALPKRKPLIQASVSSARASRRLARLAHLGSREPYILCS